MQALPAIRFMVVNLILLLDAQSEVHLPPDSWANDVIIDSATFIDLEANRTYILSPEAFFEHAAIVNFRFYTPENNNSYYLQLTHRTADGEPVSHLDYVLFNAFCWKCNRTWESQTTSANNVDILKITDMRHNETYFIEYNVFHFTRRNGDSILEVDFREQLSPTKGCLMEPVITDRTGQIKMLDYEPSVQCEWLITPSEIASNEQVFLRIIEFEIEEFFDVFEIYDGDRRSSSPLVNSADIRDMEKNGLFSENDWPLVRSSNHSLLVVFSSDVDIQLRGVDFEWFVAPDRQMEAALALKESAIDSWTLDPDVNLCSQDVPGIVCIWNSVIDFDAQDANASGSLPDEIEFFDELREIFCRGQNFPQQFPDTFGNLTQLRKIFFQDCDVHHPLPASWGNFVNLEEWELSPCLERGPLPDMTRLTRLESIDLDGCGLTIENLSWVSLLPKLRVLRISNNFAKSRLPEFHPDVLEQFFLIIEADNNELFGEIPTSWTSLPATLISLRQNNLTGDVPDWGTRDVLTMNLGSNSFTCPVLDYDSFSTINDANFYEQPNSCVGGELLDVQRIADQLRVSDWNFYSVHYCDLNGVTCRPRDRHLVSLNFSNITIEGNLSEDLFSGLESLMSITVGENPLVYCPLADYSSWANQTDFDPGRQCFTCDVTSLLQETKNAIPSQQSGCSGSDSVGTTCALECNSLSDAIRGDFSYTCAGSQGYVGEPLVCAERCSLSNVITDHIIADSSTDCNNDANGEICLLGCQPGFIPMLSINGSDPGDSRLTCQAQGDLLRYDRPPLRCTSPCRLDVGIADTNRLQVVEGCELDGQGDVCKTQCRARTILDRGEHTRTCRFSSGAFRYTDDVAVCDDADYYVAVAAVLPTLFLGGAVAVYIFVKTGDLKSSLIAITVGFSLLDFVAHILFIVERFEKADIDGRLPFVILALVIVALTIALNLGIASYVVYCVLKSSSEVRTWVSDHQVESAALLVLSAANAETMSLLAYDEIRSPTDPSIPESRRSQLKAAFQQRIKRLLQTGVLCVNLFEDIPLLCLQIAFIAWTHITTYIYLALSATICSIAFSIFKYLITVFTKESDQVVTEQTRAPDSSHSRSASEDRIQNGLENRSDVNLGVAGTKTNDRPMQDDPLGDTPNIDAGESPFPQENSFSTTISSLSGVNDEL